MNRATRVFTSTFGAIMALAGIEHGIGEMLQGNTVPDGIMIFSWPDSAFFRIVAGEPAMTVIPNLLVTGILAVLVSLIMLVWTIFFVHKKHGGLIMILISCAMLLVGGGIFPPILSILIALVSTKIHSPLNWWRGHLSADFRNFLAKLWLWFYVAGILSFLTMVPGSGLLGYFFGVDDPNLILIILCCMFGFPLLTIFSGFARDTLQQKPKTQG